MSLDLDQQTRIVQIIQSISGSLSLVGSLLILQILLASKHKLNTTYRRLIFGMSFFDACSSCAQAFSLIPTTSIVGCNIQGFFMHIGTLVTQMYNGCLCIYYVLTVCYDKQDLWIRKRVEPFFHGVAILWNISTGIFLWVTQNFNHAGANCWIAPSPRDCVIDDHIECVRGHSAIQYRWWFSGYQTIFIFILVVVSMMMMVGKVIRQERIMEKRFSVMPRNIQSLSVQRNDNDEEMEKHSPKLTFTLLQKIRSFRNRNSDGESPTQDTHVTPGMVRAPSNSSNGAKREMVKQAFVYVLAYFLPFIFPVIFQILYAKKNERVFPVWILLSLFMPLQGFLNAIVFVRPRIVRYQKNHPDASWRQAFVSTVRVSSSSNWRSRGTRVKAGSSARNSHDRVSDSRPHMNSHRSSEKSADYDHTI